jgi:hypothetical protein
VKRTFVFLILLLIAFPMYSQNEKLGRIAKEKMKDWENPFPQWKHIAKPKLDSILIQKDKDSLILFFAPGLTYYPFREDNIPVFSQSVKKSLGRRFRKYNINIMCGEYNLSQLVPNYFRKSVPIDSTRLPLRIGSRPVSVRKTSNYDILKGLDGKSVALWHSHGYYYEMNLDRWEWQRARLFGTVEDVAVMAYVVPYLTQMLENSGARVYLPRERDTQVNEIIVDNDKSTGNSEVVLHVNSPVITVLNEGFLLTDTLFSGYNPFTHGTSLRLRSDSAVYIPEIREKGYYAVYVSFPMFADNDTKVKYRVLHSGGVTDFTVNQTIGGNTWIYLGTFHFNAGKNISNGSVTVKGSGGNYFAIDALRFGGGMGNVARKPSPGMIQNQKSLGGDTADGKKQDLSVSPEFGWKLSQKPRYIEAARYYLQYAGMPDSLVYSPTFYKNDYNDDYQSRGNWVNYLLANPYNSDSSKSGTGLGLPIDLSLGFHTDAGITTGDSVIGTLGIYSTGADLGKFPDGTSRMASRDMTDILQTEIVNDIRRSFDPEWTRRGLWDRPYSEARRPNVPAMLLELLSHQNLADQRYGLDPGFRFAVCRSIYKGILKYLSYVENRDYIVQPLPVNNFAVVPLQGNTVRLSWDPVADSLEPTATPEKYKVYTRIGENGFDNGFVVDKPVAEIELQYDSIYSFKVTAINSGGESFDSEVLSAGIKKDDRGNVLVVNGFDRICGPQWFDKDGMAGIAWWQDRGVADHYEYVSVGDQYDFDRKSPWLDDDAPGWGASYGDITGQVISGNTFDYPYMHGKAIMASGYSFYSVSDEYFCSAGITSSWKNIDLIFGEEKSTQDLRDSTKSSFSIYTPELMQKISEMTASGSNIFMSGSYVGSDLKAGDDSTAIKFADKILHFKIRTGHSVKTGGVYSTDYAKSSFTGSFTFNTGNSDSIYSVEAPDAIEPSDKAAITSFRYSENNSSSGVAFNGRNKTIILGFPFESILSEQGRNRLMGQILRFFEK